MLRLCAKAHPKDVPCVHDSLNAVVAYPLYCVGQELSVAVSTLVLVRRLCDSNGCVLSSIYCRQLFGIDEDSGNELDEAEQQGENGK